MTEPLESRGEAMLTWARTQLEQQGWRLIEPAAESEPEEDTESLIEQLDEALCSLLHTGGDIGEHSPRTHLDLFYARTELERSTGGPESSGSVLEQVSAILERAPAESETAYFVAPALSLLRAAQKAGQ